jgi:hypothetical protein
VFVAFKDIVCVSVLSHIRSKTWYNGKIDFRLLCTLMQVVHNYTTFLLLVSVLYAFFLLHSLLEFAPFDVLAHLCNILFIQSFPNVLC